MKKILLITIISLAFISCGEWGEESNSNTKQNSNSTVFNKAQKNFLYNLFNSEYLWANEVEYQDYSNFTNPQDMIRAFKNSKDKWSYYETIEENDDREKQKDQGFGCYARKAKIYRMRFNSPCELAGLKRGDIIKQINGKDISNDVYYSAEAKIGVEAIFSIQRGNNMLNIKITPKYYKFKTVKHQVFNLHGQKIAYLIFDSFTSASIDELENAFDFFKANNVDELIIDLRYNGGGSLATASILLDKIAGDNNENRLQYYLKWNSDYSRKNERYYFEKDDNSLNLNKIYFLTTENTASASEIVINALKPYLDDVILIGSKTHGKPVGMRGRKKNGLIYWLINFAVYNANDESEYFQGLDVTCNVQDKYDYSRNNTNDALLKKALYYIKTGNCN